MEITKKNISAMSEYQYDGKTVLLRLDINSPIDPVTKKIVNENRIKKSAPTVKTLLESGAKLAILAHQGDTLDYQNVIPMAEHAEKLTKYVGKPITYIDDVCGPAAIAAVKALKKGEAILLGNTRYLSEEVSTFETVVKLTPEQMTKTYLVRSLAPVCDYYVNDAFSAAHRSCPSMVAFQELLPSAAGTLLFDEYTALKTVLSSPAPPSVFVLGGAKISDAFGMMKTVLENGTADKILTSGVTGVIMLLASGKAVGDTYEKWLADRSLLTFITPAKELLALYGDKLKMPIDFAYALNGVRHELSVSELPKHDCMFLDIGAKTIEAYTKIIAEAGTIFVNGPAGVYEETLFQDGTAKIWAAIAKASGYSVIGGGDTVSAASKFIDLADISYVCTAGGAMVQFLSGKKLPLIEAMEKAKK